MKKFSLVAIVLGLFLFSCHCFSLAAENGNFAKNAPALKNVVTTNGESAKIPAAGRSSLVAKKSTCPISFDYRTSLLDDNTYVIQMLNNAGRAVILTLSCKRSGQSKYMKTFEFGVSSGGYQELGWVQGWDPQDGDQILVEVSGYDESWLYTFEP